MKKYKQAIIPSVKTKNIKANRKSAALYYQENIAGKSVINKHLGIKIKFTKIGKYELSHGRAIYAKKVAVIECLPLLLEIAVYNNFGARKPTDPASYCGYMNFKVHCFIDGKKECIRISCVLRTDGSLYYNHEISIKK